MTDAERQLIKAAERWHDSTPQTGLIATIDQNLHVAVRNLRLERREQVRRD